MGFGILAAAFRVSLAKLLVANNIVVLGMFVAIALFLVASKQRPGLRKSLIHEIRVFIVGFLVWGLFVVHANLLGLKILTGHNVAFLGFLVFVACLGYVSARRTFANEERLLAINKELEIARRIQASTLPQNVPALTGLEIAARYVPMSAVAGDFYDFLSVDEKRVGVLVADVTGHGVPAALIASRLKVAFAGQAAHAHDPARVLTGLNRALSGKFEEHFVTAAYLFVDLEKNLLRYSAAGHPPLLLAWRATGKVVEIEDLLFRGTPRWSRRSLPALHGRRLRSQEHCAGRIRQVTVQRIPGSAARCSCHSFRQRPSQQNRELFRSQLRSRTRKRHHLPRPRLPNGGFVSNPPNASAPASPHKVP